MNEIPGDAGPAAPPQIAATPVEHFAARCAHDLNNLLTGILGNLELMQNRARRNGIGEFDGYLESARHAAGRTAAFTQRLLAFSGRTHETPMPVPVNGVVRDVAELMRGQDFAVATDLAEDAGQAFCDPVQLELALAELLANARDATAPSGAVTLRTRAAAGGVEIVIADSGPGMAPEVLARAADPFYSTRPSGAGKGLGLAIADNVARHAGGTLVIASAAAEGTTVTLTLPHPPG